MGQFEIQYLDDLRTEITHQSSGEKILTDAPKDNQGEGRFFSPTDMLASSVGSCMLTILGIYCRTHQLDLKGATCHVEKIMTSNPRRVGKLIVRIKVLGKFEESVRKKIMIHCKACPVSKSLHPDIKQEIEFDFEAC